MLKADLHIHSQYSFDSRNALEDIVKRCQETGINCVAIADHGTAEGGLRLQKIAPFPVIVAEEILTPAGEIMGMFLQETIETKIPLEDAIKRIKAQGGLVNVPHPFDKYNRDGLGKIIMEQHIDDVDIIEVFNARSPLPSNSRQSLKFATKHGKPGSAGSDSHTIAEIGRTYIEIPEFKTKEEFLISLKKGKIHGHMSGPFVHFGSLWARVKKPSV
jgi:predicted metal-dependent phosphoesterase TrpH